MSKRNRNETLRVAPAMVALPGGAMLAETIAALGGTVTLEADGSIGVSVPAEHRIAAEKAVKAFEDAQ